MAYIEVIDEDEATGELAEVYEHLRGKRGRIANILKAHSLNPAALRTHMDLYLAIMFGRSKLSREFRELVAVVVSSSNDCAYCVGHHAEALQHFWKDRERIERVLADPATAGLSARVVAALAFAVKLTREPAQAGEEDTRALRGLGFSDDEILDLTLTVGYFNFVNRVALGLGVASSSDEVAGYRY